MIEDAIEYSTDDIPPELDPIQTLKKRLLAVAAEQRLPLPYMLFFTDTNGRHFVVIELYDDGEGVSENLLSAPGAWQPPYTGTLSAAGGNTIQLVISSEEVCGLLSKFISSTHNSN